jgi:hypothetical protein
LVRRPKPPPPRHTRGTHHHEEDRLRRLHKTAAVLGLITATAAVVARRRSQPSLQQQAAEVRGRYRQEAATLRADGHSVTKDMVLTRAMKELNELRVRYLESLDEDWHELSALDKFRISVEFGMADPETVCVEQHPGTLRLTKTNEGRVREQVAGMMHKGG